MILILIVALFGFGECTGGGPAIGVNSGYEDLLGNLKKVSDYGTKNFEQQVYLNDYNGDDKSNGYAYQRDGKKGDRRYVEYKEYDNEQNYDDKKDIGYDNRNDEDGYDDQNDDKRGNYDDKEDSKRDDDKDDDKRGDYDGYDEYGNKYEKYDPPKDYLVSDKNDRPYRGKYYGKMGSDPSEYDYNSKCDYGVKDCKDGRDCYDNAKDRNSYNTCRDTYGTENRYYDEEDRYTGDRYRYNGRDRYGYEKDCYDNSKGRAEYDKCRQYYRKCSENDKSEYKYSYNEDDWKNDKDCYDQANLVGLGRNNREDQLIRPCALEDRECIRKYFAENSKCKPAYGPIPDPLYLKRNTAYFSFANISVVMTRLRVTGLSSIKISEFYINKDTKNLVIAFDFENLNETSPKAYVRYKRTAKESIVLNDYAFVGFRSGTFTAVIPKIPHLRLDLAEVHADIDDPIVPFFLGPKGVASTDPDVATAFARLASNMPVAIQEFFLLQSNLFTAIYIQENICDFGIKLKSI